MAKIPFTLEAWLKDKSQKVETRNGRPAHYIGLDRAGWQVFEIFRTNGTREYTTYHDSYLYSGPGESPFDLFIVTPEQELTEFEQSVRDCIVENLTSHGREMSSTVFIDDETTKKLASELFGLARNQLQIEGLVTMEHLNKASEAEYQSGLADGKNEALNDLPRWKKVGVDTGQTNLIKGYKREEDELYRNGKCISLVSLEKLPGFKEDEQ